MFKGSSNGAESIRGTGVAIVLPVNLRYKIPYPGNRFKNDSLYQDCPPLRYKISSSSNLLLW
jgi:hypothetical protein